MGCLTTSPGYFGLLFIDDILNQINGKMVGFLGLQRLLCFLVYETLSGTYILS